MHRSTLHYIVVAQYVVPPRPSMRQALRGPVPD
jgi:hypothetical protein